MKKFLSVLLAVLMCVLPLAGNMAVSAAGAQATYTLSDAEGYAGEEVVVKVNLTVNETFNTIGFAGIEYDEDALEFKKCTVDSELKGMCALTKFDKNRMTLVAAFKTEDDDVEPIDPPTEFDGVVCTITFKIKEDAPVGKFDVAIGDSQVKMDSDLLDAEVEAGTVTVLGKDFDPALKFVDKKVTYNGEEHMIEVQNLPDFAEVEYTVDGEAFDGAKNVGEYEITALVTAPGYNEYEETATLTITPKKATVNVTVPGKEYDGTTEVLEDVVVNLEGFVGGDDVEVVFDEFEYRSADAKTVEVDWNATVEGKDADNYDVEFKVSKATITKKDVVIKVDDVDLTVGDDMPSEYTYTTDPELGENYAKLVGTVAVAKGANTNAAGTYEIKGTFTAKSNPNYNITDIVNGTLTVEDKPKQEVELDYDVPADVVYGNAAFKAGFQITDATTSANVNANARTTYETTNDSVAVVDETGVVTFVGAGKATIIAKREGSDEYAEFTEKIDVSVEKLAVTIIANSTKKRVGKAAPEFTYTIETADDIDTPDEFNVTLSCDYEDVAGKKFPIVVEYSVENEYCYDVETVDGELEIIDKNPTKVVVDEVIEATYGDVSVAIVPALNAFDEALPAVVEFTYESDNAEVATVEADGNVTFVGVGTATVTVSYAGDADYAAATAKVEVKVSEKEVTVENVNLETKTADVIGLVDGDNAAVDFNKVMIAVEDTEYVVTNFVLVGEDADKYVVATAEVRILVEEAGDVQLAEVTDGGTENGSIEGLGTYLVGSEVTLTAVPKGNYKFENWLKNGEEYEGEATITIVLTENVEFTAEFKKGKSPSVVGGLGGGSTPERTVTFVIDDKNSDKVTVEKGAKVSQPKAPEREGYTFEGWFTDKACTKAYDFNTKVESSITLYAKWAAVEEEPKEEDPTEEEPKEEEPAEWTNPYSDVKDGDWFYDAVKTVTENGIMNGMKEGEFAPNVQLTRAMLVTMLYRIEGSPEVDGDVAYTDVNLGEYYGDALVWATENKIVNGISETEFAPNANITREQIATIIFRYAGFKGVEAVELSENLHFADADQISDYAVAPMNWLVGKEIIKGYENNTIQPQGNATRAEVATIIARVLAYLG